MSFEHDVSALAAEAAGARARIARVKASIGRMTQVQADARALFLDEGGQVRPEAARLFNHLCARSDMAASRAPVSDAELREALGAQRMVRLIMDSLLLDTARLAHLQNLLNQLKGSS